jgi:hypothetical protein
LLSERTGADVAVLYSFKKENKFFFSKNSLFESEIKNKIDIDSLKSKKTENKAIQCNIPINDQFKLSYSSF